MKETKKFLGIIAITAIIGFSMNACDIEQGGGTHTHQWGAWQSNATQHWKECSCGEEYGRANHTGNPCGVCDYNSGGGSSYSLNGVWEGVGSGGWQITISGNSGIYNAFGTNINTLTQDAINKGYLKLGDQCLRNLTSTGNLTWSGQKSTTTYNIGTPNVAIGTSWINCTVTMSGNGQTITVAYTDTSGSGTETWTRSNYKLDGVWEGVGSGGWQITISGNSGIYNAFGTNINTLTQDAINKGYLKLGDQCLRNLTSTGNLTWSGQKSTTTYNIGTPNVATGTSWINCTVTMSANGQTITVAYTDTSGSGTETWIRRR